MSDIIVHLTEFSVNIFKLLQKKKQPTNQREENPNPEILASSENWLGRFMELILVKRNYVSAFQIFPTQLCRSQSSDHQRNG